MEHYQCKVTEIDYDWEEFQDWQTCSQNFGRCSGLCWKMFVVLLFAGEAEQVAG